MSNIVLSQNGRVSTTDLIIEENGLDKITRYANMLAQSSMTPQQWQGKPVDCGMITMKALALGFNPMDFIQGVYCVKGNVSYKSSMIISMIHNSGLVQPRTFTQFLGDWDNIQFRKGSKFHGNEEGLSVKVGFKFIGDEEVTWGAPLAVATQTTRNSSLWETDIQTQMTYLAARRWSNVYLPGVTMGMVGHEEAQDYAQPERDITPQAPSMVSPDSEVVQFAKAEVKHEDQADIEDYIEETVNTVSETQSVARVVREEPKKEEPKAPQAGDLDELGTPFEPEFMTGTKLKSDGSWRLNKAGQERKREQEEAEQQAEQQQEQPAQEGTFVKAVHDDSIDMLGGSGPFSVINFDKNGGLVEIEGQEGNWLPLVDGETVYLEIVNPSVDEASLKTKESLDAALNQAKSVTVKLQGKVESIGNEELKKEALEVIAKWESNTKAEINKVAIKGNKATEGDFKHLTEVNTNYWNEALKAVKHFQEKDEEQDNPFQG